MPEKKIINAVYFDLDGTLIDSAPDLVGVTNQLLIENDKQTLPFESLRPYVSGGSPALLKKAFNITPNDNNFEELKNRFLDIYSKAYLVNTCFFSGIESSLNFLEEQKITWGIVTNKPEYLTTPLLKDMELSERASIVICGDTYATKKPDPYPLLQAANLTKRKPENALYIGDDERDIIAARAANMISVTAEWGYLSGKDPKDWDADHRLNKSTQLESFLKQQLK